MIKKTIILFITILICASLNAAQKKDYHKIEVSGGYSIMWANGIVGDGDIFTDDLNDPLINTFPTFPSSNIPASGLITPGSFSGKNHRATMHGFSGSAVYNFSKYFGAKVEISGNYRSNDVQTSSVALVVPCQLPISPCISTTIDNPNSFRGILVYPLGNSRTSQKNYNYLGGIQIKNNSTEKRFKPFAHAMAGISQQTVNLKDFTDNGNTFDRANDARKIFGTDKIANKGLAMQFGGGIDIRLNNRMDIRLVQVDYNPVKIKEQQILAVHQSVTGINIVNTLSLPNTASPGFTQYSAYDVKIRSRWQNNFRVGFGIVFH